MRPNDNRLYRRKKKNCPSSHPQVFLDLKLISKRHNAFIGYKSLLFFPFSPQTTFPVKKKNTIFFIVLIRKWREIQVCSTVFWNFQLWVYLIYWVEDVSSITSSSFTCEKCRLVSTLTEKIQTLQRTTNSKRCNGPTSQVSEEAHDTPFTHSGGKCHMTV